MIYSSPSIPGRQLYSSVVLLKYNLSNLFHSQGRCPVLSQFPFNTVGMVHHLFNRTAVANPVIGKLKNKFHLHFLCKSLTSFLNLLLNEAFKLKTKSILEIFKLDLDFSGGIYLEVTFSPGNNFISTNLSLSLNLSFTTFSNELKTFVISFIEKPVLLCISLIIFF